MNRSSSNVLRLFLVRHGQTAANTEMRYLGVRDDPLTELGQSQAENVAAALAVLPVHAVFSSPLRRTADTASRIAAACRIEPQHDVRLREGSFGSWEGLTRAEVMQRSEEDARLLRRWETDPQVAPPAGESFVEIQNRIVEFVRETSERLGDSSAVLVSHVGPIKALLASVLDVPLKTAQRLFLDPATITVVDWGRRPLLRMFNSHAHLGWERARWMAGSLP